MKFLKKFTTFTIAQLLDDYSRYLLNTRGLQHRTIQDYCIRVREFLRTVFKNNRVSINRIKPEYVINFILQTAKTKSSNYAQTTTYPLRSFFRYLKQTQHTPTNLDMVVPSVANRKIQSYPEVLSRAQVEKILRCCNRKEAKGLRDYAMILLMCSLGLRSCEVASLNMDDIDLRRAEIIIRGKGVITRMPLLNELGTAIINYLKHGRPHSLSNRVFITHRLPFSPITTDGIRSMFRSVLKNAGLKPAKEGTHLLRHTFAMHLLEQGATLVEIGMILRHKDIESTAIYARADFSTLRKITLSWPIKTRARRK